jgi:hypothetical protein
MDMDKEIKKICKEYNIELLFIDEDKFKIEERRELMGKCFIVSKCDWWNPPIEMVYDGTKRDFCIQCWKFKKID